MTQAFEFRLGGCAIAALVGLGIPLFLLGPCLFGGLPLHALPAAAAWGAAAAAAFGAWLSLVCVFAEDRIVEEVVGPFQGAEAVVLFIPRMLVVGSRALWRRARGHAGLERR